MFLSIVLSGYSINTICDFFLNLCPLIFFSNNRHLTASCLLFLTKHRTGQMENLFGLQMEHILLLFSNKVLRYGDRETLPA